MSRSRLSPPSMASPSRADSSRMSRGAKLQRPELFRLLGDSKPGDILLVEAIDRLSRLTTADWLKLQRDRPAADSRRGA